MFDIGVTPAGEILICSVRARALITYDQDGVETGQRQTCEWKDANRGMIPSATLYDSPDAKVPDIAFSWLAALAVPLWHPMLAWLMVVLAGLYLKSRSPKPCMPHLMHFKPFARRVPGCWEDCWPRMRGAELLHVFLCDANLSRPHSLANVNARVQPARTA